MKNWILLLGISLLGACSPQLLKRDQINDVLLIQTKGRVIRYNCEGDVTSNRIEVVQTPSRWLEWQPENETELYTSSFKNQETGDRPMIVNHTQFEVSMERGDLFSARVVEGLNTFDYEFRVCDEWVSDPVNGDRSCQKDSSWEKGEFQIDVEYRRETTDEVREVHPSAEECAESSF